MKGDGSICTGDSGGPLVDLRGALVGIASGSVILDGVMCTTNSVAVYTPIVKHLDFVDEALAAGAEEDAAANAPAATGCSVVTHRTSSSNALVVAVLGLALFGARRRIRREVAGR